MTPTDKAFIFTLSEDQANDTSGYEVKDVKTSVSGQGKASLMQSTSQKRVFIRSISRKKNQTMMAMSNMIQAYGL